LNREIKFLNGNITNLSQDNGLSEIADELAGSGDSVDVLCSEGK
jgi:hypothetical protein